MLRVAHPPKKLILPFLSALYKSGKRTLCIENSCDFYIDRIASAMGFEVHSCDDSIIGRTIASTLLQGVTTPECNDEKLNAVFAAWQKHRCKPLIEILFALKIGVYADQKNDYQKAKYQTYLREAGAFYRQSISALERSRYLDFKIASFQPFCPTTPYPLDAHFIRNLLPISLKNSKPFSFAERIFSFGSEKTASKRKNIRDYDSAIENKDCTIISKFFRSDWDAYLRGKSGRQQTSKSVFLYSNFKSPMTFSGGGDAQKSIQPLKIIPLDFQLPENTRLSVLKCKLDYVNYYKQLFMSNRVDYSRAGDLGIAFLVDDFIFGFASFFQRMRTMDQERFIFMNSDFVVPSRIPKLSKLLLYLLCSTEIRQIVARHYLFSYPSLQTTVFTDKPVSMKYRGVFQKSGGNVDGKLTYVADFTNESLLERYQRWKTRTKTG